jgi:hypothetical protein
MNRIRLLLAVALGATISILAPPLQAHEPQPASATRLLTTASTFLASLSPEQRQKAVFAVDDPERKDWSNVPHTLHPRKGVSLGELSPEQRVKAHYLIQAGLSSQGYLKASGIMHQLRPRPRRWSSQSHPLRLPRSAERYGEDLLKKHYEQGHHQPKP